MWKLSVWESGVVYFQLSGYQQPSEARDNDGNGSAVEISCSKQSGGKGHSGHLLGTVHTVGMKGAKNHLRPKVNI